MQQFPPLVDCWYLTGSTASGKTSVSLALAEHLQAEIISLDSMAVYRGMDIGTAKPSAADQSRVPHHLIDVVDPNQPYSLADFLAAAHEIVQRLRQQNRRALFVGGTPLYLKSLLRGACEGPPADPDFRRQVEAEIAEIGLEPLRERLRHVDPLSAAKLHPNDTRRMIRALEVQKLTGTPMSHYQMQFDRPPAIPAARVFTLSWPRAELHDRIHQRVDEMFAAGLIDEVQTLLDRFGSFSTTALQGVGYRETLSHLEGSLTREQTIETVKSRTRRFARRQETWFRGLAECRWLPRSNAVTSVQIADEISQLGRTKSPQ